MEESPWSCLNMSFSPDSAPRQQQPQYSSSQTPQRRLELLRRRMQQQQQQQPQQAVHSSLSGLLTSPSRSSLSFGHYHDTTSPFAGLQLHQSILPPLPSQDPSPFGRPSSPRNRASLPNPFSPSTTVAKNALLDTSTSIATSPSTNIARTTTTTTTTTTTNYTATTSARLPPRDSQIAPASTTPQRRSAQYPSRFEPADDWIDHQSSNLPFAASPLLPENQSDHDQELLLALAETDFSSPSTYPSFTNPILQRPAFGSISPLGQRYPPIHRAPLQPSSSTRATVNTGSSTSAAAPSAFGPSPAPPFSLHPRFLNQGISPHRQQHSDLRFTRPNLSFDLADLSQPASRPATTLPNHSFVSRDVDNLAANHHHHHHHHHHHSPRQHSSLDAMPTRGHAREPPSTPSRDIRSSHKRRRLSGHSGQRPPRRASRAAAAAAAASEESSLFIDDGDDDDLFGESPAHSAGGRATANAAAEEYTTIDLTEATEVPEELKKPVVDKRIKLAKFQCVICMDDAKTLTITHCGHMYCAKCLHSSLHAEPTRGKCPMCRAKIDMKPRDSYSSKTKGYWPLELKLMTATRKGKRKADGGA